MAEDPAPPIPVADLSCISQHVPPLPAGDDLAMQEEKELQEKKKRSGGRRPQATVDQEKEATRRCQLENDSRKLQNERRSIDNWNRILQNCQLFCDIFLRVVTTVGVFGLVIGWLWSVMSFLGQQASAEQQKQLPNTDLTLQRSKSFEYAFSLAV